ncbi:hypothetical protein [Catenovulum agarivorans]|uniref:hypothetical protein n=1 Tax=Catenovulum agarivorans TaxID=1172192 RepID=UPI0002FB096D|nr:hypothetical protein [Catenovulum agarivorans]
MENNIYTIADEPKPKKLSYLVQNPTMIIFASILIPIFWTPPFAGRLWMPLVWIVINGYLLGSISFKKELGIAIGAVFAMFCSFFALGALIQLDNFYTSEQMRPYFQLFLNGILFFSLYWISSKQEQSYSLFQYAQGNHHG